MSDKPILDGLTFTEVDEPERPPRVERTTSKRRKSKPAPPYKEGELIPTLTRAYAYMALGIMPFAPETANALMSNAESCAKSWDDWARTSPTVRKALYALRNTSAGLAVAGAHLPIVLAVATEVAPQSRLAQLARQFVSTDDTTNVTG